MSSVLAIDPGNVESAWALIDADSRAPLNVGKAPNAVVRRMLRDEASMSRSIAVEMIASYGMPVGAEVFDTCVAIGRYVEIAPAAKLIYRRDVKLHHCGSPRAGDANITQALVDRFAHGQPNKGKGTKTNPGWFHGFRADIWAAYAIAVYVADTANAGVVAA